MRLLNRSAPPQFDEHLTFFTVDQAREFRRLVERSFARAGRDVSVYPDHLEDRSGTTFNLCNLGLLCVGVPSDEWTHVIDDHVGLVTTPTRELSELPQEELEARLYLRLADTGSLPDPDSVAYARPLTPGLMEVLSVDLEDSVATPTRDELATRGTLGELVDRGRRNLEALLASGGVTAAQAGNGQTGRYTAVSGDSFFTASLGLMLQETIERFTDEDDWGRGSLVAVPSRHQLLYRPINGPDSEAALHRMLDAALFGFSDGVGPLSPDVFWVRNRQWTQVTSWRSGKPRVLRDTGVRDALKGFGYT
jgi:hypothetical protein